MICLDTNAVISAMNNRPPTTVVRLSAALAAGIEVRMSSIVLFELWYGIAKSLHPGRSADRLRNFLSSPITVLDFAAEDASDAGEIRAALERAGTPIGSYDILIAAQARRRSALLVTANTGEFRRVPGLRIENWTTAF